MTPNWAADGAQPPGNPILTEKKPDSSRMARLAMSAAPRALPRFCYPYPPIPCLALRRRTLPSLNGPAQTKPCGDPVVDAPERPVLNPRPRYHPKFRSRTILGSDIKNFSRSRLLVNDGGGTTVFAERPWSACMLYPIQPSSHRPPA